MTTDTGAAPVTTPPSVLIAEDDEPLARFFARALEAAGYEVRLARDGADAKQTLSSQKFDAIVSEISMPGMSGIELLEAIRRHDLDVPVILVTGEPELATAVSAPSSTERSATWRSP